MTIQRLIEILEQYPKDMEVIQILYSDYKILEEKDIDTFEACEDRGDGWVQNKRPDKPFKAYLRFNGN